MPRIAAVVAGLSLFTVTLGVAAQQAPAPNSSIILPTPRPITVVPKADAVNALPGVHKPLQRPRVKVEDQVEEFNEHQRAQLERRNRAVQQRFQAFQSAGGWQQAFLSQLQEQRAVLPNSREQLDLAAQFIGNFLFCGQPLIASVDSQFQDVTIPGLVPPTLDKSFVVEPLASIVIDGCNFGTDVGEVRLILNQDTGSFLTLQISGWGDNNIMATLDRHPGIPDQDAQLIVIRKDGTASFPTTVQFFQHRVGQVFDVAKHSNDVAVVETAHTTQDQIEGVIFSDTGIGAIAGSHYTFCCSAVSGTDRWLFKLQNGWQVPATPLVYSATQFDQVRGVSNGDFLLLSADGSRECGIFSSGEGFITSTDLLGSPADFPEFQSEVDIAWHVGSNCSGVVYVGTVIIFGPEGLPYD